MAARRRRWSPTVESATQAESLCYVAAEPAIPFCRTLSNSSASVTGGKHVLPEQISAEALSFGKCGSVKRSAAGKFSKEDSGVTRNTAFPKP